MSFAPNPIEQMRAEGRKTLRPEDIKAYGIERLLAEQEKLGPLQLPKLHFTEEENRVMDELIAAEKAASAHGA